MAGPWRHQQRGVRGGIPPGVPPAPPKARAKPFSLLWIPVPVARQKHLFYPQQLIILNLSLWVQVLCVVLSVFFNRRHPPSHDSGLKLSQKVFLIRRKKKSSVFRHSRVGWRMRARRRPDRIWSIEVKRIFRQKRYTKVFGKKASERERHLNGNYALCTHYALLMH
jgi:hypothetical protein